LRGALSEIGGEPIAVTGAGRTDAGVHASAQVAHFETSVERPNRRGCAAQTRWLPKEIAVQWATPVPGDFHAALLRALASYRYVLYSHPVRPALFAGRTGWFHLQLDLEGMREAADFLVGEHDFSSFRPRSARRRPRCGSCKRRDTCKRRVFPLDFTANAFLHHHGAQYRRCLVYVGKGKRPPQWIPS